MPEIRQRAMRWKRTTIGGLLAAAAVCLAGCGGNLVAVTGTVTLDGQRLTTGTVTFHPAGKGPTGYAQIGSDGTFSARTGADEGLAPGDYRITVVATGPMPESTPQNRELPPPRITPDKYASPKTSDLKCTVPGGPLKLELRSK
jgi:hypothetical protein